MCTFTALYFKSTLQIQLKQDFQYSAAYSLKLMTSVQSPWLPREHFIDPLQLTLA